MRALWCTLSWLQDKRRVGAVEAGKAAAQTCDWNPPTRHYLRLRSHPHRLPVPFGGRRRGRGDSKDEVHALRGGKNWWSGQCIHTVSLLTTATCLLVCRGAGLIKLAKALFVIQTIFHPMRHRRASFIVSLLLERMKEGVKVVLLALMVKFTLLLFWNMRSCSRRLVYFLNSFFFHFSILDFCFSSSDYFDVTKIEKTCVHHCSHVVWNSSSPLHIGCIFSCELFTFFFI